ncbi:MAG: hypothetical protein FWC62_00835 [Firmicutes bacterium]|nr:hypothetical protein [Bacillota bacterium]
MNYMVWFRMIQMAGILLASFYIFYKSIGHVTSSSRKICCILWALLWAALYGLKPVWLPLSLVLLIYCAVTIALLWKINGIKLEMAISAYLLALGIGYALYYAVTLLSAVPFTLILGPGKTGNYAFTAPDAFNNPAFFVLYSIIFVLQLFLSWLLFRIRRFRNGFSFLFQRYALWIMLVVTGVLLVLVTLLTNPGNPYYNFFYAAGILVIGAGIIIGVRRAITATYRRRMLEQNITLLEKQLGEKEAELVQLRAQNEVVRVANHKINRRLSSLERGVSAMVIKAQSVSGMSAEMGEELTGALDEIRQLAQEYQDEVAQAGGQKLLPSTKLKAVDDLFAFYQARCAADKVQFNLRVNGSIPYFAEYVFPQNKLETMIGDHLQDALVAVKIGDNPSPSILVVLGLAGDCYEFSVYDNGIEFAVDTLLRLGKEQVTTHADMGGSGIGFMTTFASVDEYGASLIIEERRPDPADYSKAITVRFDKKGQYIVKTYRPEQFPPTGNHPQVIGETEKNAD